MIDQQAHDGLPASLRRFLDLHLDLDDRAAALNDPDVPSSVLREFLLSLTSGQREVALAMCERTEILQRWAVRGTVAERILVAFNPCTPAASLLRLADDPEARVRMQLAYNPGTAPDVLAQLLLDDVPEVQQSLAGAFDTEEGQALRRGIRTADCNLAEEDDV